MRRFLVSNDFCLYLYFLKELVTSPDDFREYSKGGTIYTLSSLNRTVYKNFGLFSLSPKILNNYKKMVGKLDKTFDKEVLIAYTYIYGIEKMNIQKKDYIDYFNKLHNYSSTDIKKTIIFDYELLLYVIYHEAFYKKEFEDMERVKGSINYFKTINPLDNRLYDEFLDYYINRSKTIIFPNKLKRLFRK